MVQAQLDMKRLSDELNSFDKVDVYIQNNNLQVNTIDEFNKLVFLPFYNEIMQIKNEIRNSPNDLPEINPTQNLEYNYNIGFVNQVLNIRNNGINSPYWEHLVMQSLRTELNTLNNNYSQLYGVQYQPQNSIFRANGLAEELRRNQKVVMERAPNQPAGKYPGKRIVLGDGNLIGKINEFVGGGNYRKYKINY